MTAKALRCFIGIVEREFLRFLRQRSRFFASLVRPLVWLAIFGTGLRTMVTDEAKLYQKSEVPVDFVGHPLLDLMPRPVEKSAPGKPLKVVVDGGNGMADTSGPGAADEVRAVVDAALGIV